MFKMELIGDVIILSVDQFWHFLLENAIVGCILDHIQCITKKTHVCTLNYSHGQ